MTRRQLDRDIKRFDAVTELGWLDVRVTVEDTEASVIVRTRKAFAHRA